MFMQAWLTLVDTAACPVTWEHNMLAGLGALALRCTEAEPQDRPPLQEVVLALEDLLSSDGGRTAFGSNPAALALVVRDCAVCLDKPRDTLFLPCCHAVCCAACAQILMGQYGAGRLPCPYCRAKVTSAEPAEGPVYDTFPRPSRRPAPRLPASPVQSAHEEESGSGGASGATGMMLTWPRRARLTTADGGAPRFLAFPAKDVPGGPFAALSLAAAAKIFPGRVVDVVLCFKCVPFPPPLSQYTYCTFSRKREENKIS